MVAMPDNSAEIVRLQAMLASSQRMAFGYGDRIKAIKAALAELGVTAP